MFVFSEPMVMVMMRMRHMPKVQLPSTLVPFTNGSFQPTTTRPVRFANAFFTSFNCWIS